jgi:hypothetical protein
MKKALPRNRRLPAAAFALVTIVAMLLTPFCESMCAATNGCESAAADSESAGGACHHADISSGGDAVPVTIASLTACNRLELSATLPNGTRDWPPRERAQRSTPPDSIAAIDELTFSPGLSRARWRDATRAAGSKDMPASSTVLQI